MGKKFILNIKNKQIAEAVHLDEAKEAAPPPAKTPPSHPPAHPSSAHARSSSAHAKPSPQKHSPSTPPHKESLPKEPLQEEPRQQEESRQEEPTVEPPLQKTEKLVHEKHPPSSTSPSPEEEEQKAPIKARSTSAFTEGRELKPYRSKPKFQKPLNETRPIKRPETHPNAPFNKSAPLKTQENLPSEAGTTPTTPPPQTEQKFVKLGPTGKHVKDLLPPKREYTTREQAPREYPPRAHTSRQPPRHGFSSQSFSSPTRPPARSTPAAPPSSPPAEGKGTQKKGKKSTFKEYEDVKTSRAKAEGKTFTSLHLMQSPDEEGGHHRKRRQPKLQKKEEILTIRPDKLKIRTPISVKDLAAEMKLKAAQLIGKLFLEGVIVTINDILEDETTIELLGHEFGCAITIDKSEQERIRITSETIQEEIQSTDPSSLMPRAPVVAFMGHVDHGKTSLIDRIRSSNRTAQEAGAITQHIGAFLYETAVGPIAILDTPGHEAFSAMRARGAHVTDIVVLVVAGDEGIRQQTDEAIQHAKAAKVPIVVAINKCDKPNFNADNIYRQLADRELLPEAWGGETITVNCSAVSGEGVQQLLEMLALQAEVMELKANPQGRARGTVLESEMHKGMGAVATIIVQNGTLKRGDSIVFEEFWGRVKTMRDEYGRELLEAGPSQPIAITGLSGLPEAGQEFIKVSSEKEAKEISEVRSTDMREKSLIRTRKRAFDSFLQDDKTEEGKKVLNLILRADVQGSLEALKTAIEKIASDKVRVEVVLSGVGEISESDVQLAAASNATIIGFHTQIENHAESLLKEYQITARLHDIIYHALDDVKLLMKGTLDKLAKEEERGKAEVLALFKSSAVGTIAGCKVIEGSITRNHRMRLRRKGDVLWTGGISSIKRLQDEVREVQKGFECGIVLQGTPPIQEGDILEAFEITYIAQEI